MKRTAVLGLIGLVTACGPTPSGRAPPAQPTAAPAVTAGGPLAPDEGPPAAADRRTPVEVVRAYYDAIAARDYGQAYGLWRDQGAASGKSLVDFALGFAETESVALTTGTPSAPEGAAGSSYVTVPVIVHATLRDGTRQRFAGEYVLRRVNDVPGATADELAWRIHSASLKAEG